MYTEYGVRAYIGTTIVGSSSYRDNLLLLFGLIHGHVPHIGDNMASRDEGLRRYESLNVSICVVCTEYVVVVLLLVVVLYVCILRTYVALLLLLLV